MEWLGVIGIFVGLVFFVISAMRGYNVLITSVITAAIIILTNGMDLATYIVSDPEKSYSAGLASFIRGNMLIFLFSAILGQYIDSSGAAKRIAHSIMSKIGTNSPYLVLLGVALVGAILTYGGISMFVAMFALIPLARAMFRECNIPWHLFAASWTLGACSFTMAMIPGVPSIANINAARATGVELTAAPLMGIAGSIVAIALASLYIRIALKRAQAKNETYADVDEVIDDQIDKKLPSLFISLLPLILLIGIIIVGSALKVSNIVYIGMVVAVVAAGIVFHQYIDSQRDVLGIGARNSLGPAVFTSAAVGVGAVASASYGFTVLQEAIFNMPGGTYVSAATLAAVLGGVMGSGSGAVGIIGNSFIEPYLATGVNPAALAKIIATSATIGGALPNSGAMFGMLAAMGLNHKNSYHHIFWISIGAGFVALLVMLVMANIGLI